MLYYTILCYTIIYYTILYYRDPATPRGLAVAVALHALPGADVPDEGERYTNIYIYIYTYIHKHMY